jgi:hypothetical protein
VYPISEEKAVSLTERLSNRYIIKKLKNWNEYCQYRSDEYLSSKLMDIVIKFNNDQELPNAIGDLYNRTKDTLKNIYSEFMDMLDKDEVIKSKKNVVSDMEGQEVILDKLNTPDSYLTKIEGYLSDRNTFIKRDYINVTIDIVNTVSYKALETCLELLFEYTYKDKKNYTEINDLYKRVLENAIDYLHRNNIALHNKTNIVLVINNIIGNVLFARGTDVVINTLKDNLDKTLKTVYKTNKTPVTDRNLKNIRNALYVYIVLLAIA